MAFTITASNHLRLPTRDGNYFVQHIDVPLSEQQLPVFKAATDYSCLFDTRWNELHIYCNGMRVEKITFTSGIIPYALIIKTLDDYLLKILASPI